MQMDGWPYWRLQRIESCCQIDPLWWMYTDESLDRKSAQKDNSYIGGWWVCKSNEANMKSRLIRAFSQGRTYLWVLRGRRSWKLGFLEEEATRGGLDESCRWHGGPGMTLRDSRDNLLRWLGRPPGMTVRFRRGPTPTGRLGMFVLRLVTFGWMFQVIIQPSPMIWMLGWIVDWSTWTPWVQWPIEQLQNQQAHVWALTAVWDHKNSSTHLVFSRTCLWITQSPSLLPEGGHVLTTQRLDCVWVFWKRRWLWWSSCEIHNHQSRCGRNGSPTGWKRLGQPPCQTSEIFGWPGLLGP